MRPKSLLLDLGCRGSYICRSCLLNLQKPTPQPVASRLYSRAARHAPRQSPQQNQLRRSEAPSAPPAEQEENVTIRYFEMDPSGKVQALKDSAEFHASLHATEQQALSELEEIEKKLRENTGLRSLAEKFGLVAKRKEDNASLRDDAVDEEIDDDDEFPHPVDSSGLNTRQARQITQLNWQMQRTTRKIRKGNVKQKTVYDIWRLYSLARPLLQNAWWRVPMGAWELLWEILSWAGPANTNRMGRVYQLGKDMSTAGVPLSDSQQILHIEATFVEGNKKDAIEAWRKFVPSPDIDQRLLGEYLKLGVRMFSLYGDLDRAERALTRFLELPQVEDGSDPRCMLQYIRACAKDTSRVNKAWEAYRRLRVLLGDEMKIEDYDEVIACFLLADQTERALHVFVDMMFSGTIDLHGKTKLPLAVSNQFFLGKWLKRLIGAGDLDGALSVLKFMQSKGIMAAKIQVNGLIGAWLRSGTAENVQKAEELAWAMIRSRLMFVDLRRRESLVDWPIRLLRHYNDDMRRGEDNVGAESSSTSPSKKKANPLGLVFVPQASLETFSLMAENYKERALHVRLEELWVAFKEAEITTDAFMMNQLLESYIQAGQGEKAREVYQRLTEEHDLMPDAYTFYALYKTLAVNRIYWSAVTEDIKGEEAAICRDLFRAMISSSWTFESSTGSSAPSSPSSTNSLKSELVRMVLHSFRKCNDYFGFLIAFRGFREVLSVGPDHVTIMELLAETPDLKRNKKLIVQVSKRMQLYVAQAREAALKTGEEWAKRDLTTEEKNDQLVGMVAQFYAEKAGAAVSSEEEFWEKYEDAAQEMGLGDSFVRDAE